MLLLHLDAPLPHPRSFCTGQGVSYKQQEQRETEWGQPMGAPGCWPEDTGRRSSLVEQARQPGQKPHLPSSPSGGASAPEAGPHASLIFKLQVHTRQRSCY